MSESRRVPRRAFLKAASLAGGAFGFPTIVPSSALGLGDAVAASERIVMGSIGVGGMGTSDLRGFLGKKEVQVVAVCDVDRDHAAAAKRLVDERYGNADCAATGDFREITRRADVDAVVVATPDHWHVLPAMDAARRGKDMYVEKPLTLTVGEGRALSDVVARHGRILQTGTQQRSDGRFRLAAELVRNGRMGDDLRVDVLIPGNNKTCEPVWKPEAPPEALDYDFWLGPAPREPYHPQRCHYQFRFLLDYSGGQVTNWGAHHLDIAQWALGMDRSGPVEATGDGEFPTSGLFTTATRVDFTVRYANGVRLRCRTRPRGASDMSVTFRGSEGRLSVDRGRIGAYPESILKEPLGADAVRLYESRDHKQNFLDCVRSRRAPAADAETGHRSATVCHLGNIAMLLGRRLEWDPEAERFRNDEEADRMLARAGRAAWR